MHQVEDLKVLYRGRRYWHTPQLDQAIAKIINHFGDRGSIAPEFISGFMHGISVGGTPEGDGWNVWYEPCQVVKITLLEVIVISKDFPSEILEASLIFHSRGKSHLHNGGKFHVNRPKLQRDGMAYHSRYSEYFYINVPKGAIALPENKKLSEV